MKLCYLCLLVLFCGSILGSLEERRLDYNDPEHGPVQRMYLLYLPSNYQQAETLPLLLDFHGFTMTADEQRRYSQWDVLAEEEGFVAVFPEGVPDSPSQLRNVSGGSLDETGRLHTHFSGPGISMTMLAPSERSVIEIGK